MTSQSARPAPQRWRSVLRTSALATNRRCRENGVLAADKQAGAPSRACVWSPKRQLAARGREVNAFVRESCAPRT